jgi:hypothetical protein
LIGQEWVKFRFEGDYKYRSNLLLFNTTFYFNNITMKIVYDPKNFNIPLLFKVCLFYFIALSFVLVRVKNKVIYIALFLLALYFERFVFMISYYAPKHYTVQEKSCEVMVPINHNTNFAFIMTTLRTNTCFIHSDNPHDNVVEFCKTQKCFNNHQEDTYPISIGRFREVYCAEAAASFMKIDDNTFLSPQCYESCKKYCDEKVGCCVCGRKQGDPASGMLHGQFHFPLGMYYYANPAAKIAMCSATTKETMNEDQGFAMSVQSQCRYIDYYDPGKYCGIKRTFNYLDTETKIVKPENH